MAWTLTSLSLQSLCLKGRAYNSVVYMLGMQKAHRKDCRRWQRAIAGKCEWYWARWSTIAVPKGLEQKSDFFFKKNTFLWQNNQWTEEKDLCSAYIYLKRHDENSSSYVFQSRKRRATDSQGLQSDKPFKPMSLLIPWRFKLHGQTVFHSFAGLWFSPLSDFVVIFTSVKVLFL